MAPAVEAERGLVPPGDEGEAAKQNRGGGRGRSGGLLDVLRTSCATGRRPKDREWEREVVEGREKEEEMVEWWS
jgi:hypothetical protein